MATGLSSSRQMAIVIRRRPGAVAPSPSMVIIRRCARERRQSLGAIASVVIRCGDGFGNDCWALIIGPVLWKSESDRAVCYISTGVVDRRSGEDQTHVRATRPAKNVVVFILVLLRP